MIIESIIDTDLYKVTMGQAIFIRYPRIKAKYSFINRGGTEFPKGFDQALREEVRKMAELRLTEEEKRFIIWKCYYLHPGYIEWFSYYRFNPDEVSIRQDGGNLSIEVTGPWYRTVFWEVPLMALISELYFQMTGQTPKNGWIEKAEEKGRVLNRAGARFADFGTRRRYSSEVQRQVLEALIKTAIPISRGGVLNGTSNIYLAKEFDLTPIGTFAHEWMMAHAAMYGYRSASREALKAWAEEFEGNLGIALSDTLTTDEFLEHFTPYYANLFKGVRQDSGDPLVNFDKLLRHYEESHIDPKSKSFVPSDNLTVEKVLRILEYCDGRMQCSFGIGTHLTNDVGVKSLNMVIKMTQIVTEKGVIIPTIKLSDDPGKELGDPRDIEFAKYQLGITR